MINLFEKINLGLDSEFNSIHFGIEINRSLKFLRPNKFLGQKLKLKLLKKIHVT